MSLSLSNLFSPTTVGCYDIQHRVVMPAMSRLCAYSNGVPCPLALTYYTQRSSIPGGLIISDGLVISPESGGFENAPGMWNAEHIAAWKPITDAVHSQGGRIFGQAWSVGRVASEEVLKSIDPSFEVVSASNIPLNAPGSTVPRALTKGEIKKHVGFFVAAAKNAIDEAGFDGLEIHAGNGFLCDQFLQTVSNIRNDEYGGSVENRARFLFEVLDAVAKDVGEERVSVRLSPWSPYEDMKMPLNDTIETFSYVVNRLKRHYGKLAYVHLVEPGVAGPDWMPEVPPGESNDFLRKIWYPRRMISTGRYNRETGIQRANQNTNELIGFGRDFIANPDLPYRLKNDLQLTVGNSSRYFLFGTHTPDGYIDYPPFASEAYEAL